MSTSAGRATSCHHLLYAGTRRLPPRHFSADLSASTCFDIQRKKKGPPFWKTNIQQPALAGRAESKQRDSAGPEQSDLRETIFLCLEVKWSKHLPTAITVDGICCCLDKSINLKWEKLFTIQKSTCTDPFRLQPMKLVRCLLRCYSVPLVTTAHRRQRERPRLRGIRGPESGSGAAWNVYSRLRASRSLPGYRFQFSAPSSSAGRTKRLYLCFSIFFFCSASLQQTPASLLHWQTTDTFLNWSCRCLQNPRDRPSFHRRLTGWRTEKKAEAVCRVNWEA